MRDLISRQAAIDAVKKRADKARDMIGSDHPFCEGLIVALDIVEQLPSAQPQPKWISCSERLPEEHEWMGTKRFGTTISDEVYVTFENPKGERFCKHLNFQNGKLSSFDQSTIDALYKGSKPIAWKPLPEPYKEGEQE